MDPLIHRIDRHTPPDWVEVVFGNIIVHFSRTRTGVVETKPKRTTPLPKGSRRRSRQRLWIFITDYRRCIALARETLQPDSNRPLVEDDIFTQPEEQDDAEPQLSSCPHCGCQFPKGVQFGDECPSCEEPLFG